MGGVERPARLTAPTSTTPGPSPEERLQPVPAPLIQLASGKMGCARRVLLRSAFTGLRIVMSVLTKMRNPFNASEPSMLIATTTLEPIVGEPIIVAGLEGHPDVLVMGGAATQTMPTISPWAELGIIIGAIVAPSSIIPRIARSLRREMRRLSLK